jgi:hypothetical protein
MDAEVPTDPFNVLGECEMTSGRHYWEVEVGGVVGIMNIGVTRPDCELEDHPDNETSWFMHTYDGALLGPDGMHKWYQKAPGEKYDSNGGFEIGGKLGILVNLDEGTIDFYRNGIKHGPGFTSGVTGPLVRAASLVIWGDEVTMCENVEAPAGML